MSWRREGNAVVYEKPSYGEIVEHLAWLSRDVNRRPWQMVNGRIVESGEPTALIGGIAGIESYATIPLADLAAVTGGVANVALWESRQYTPIINPRVGQMFELDAEGTVTSTAAAQTVAINPHIGAANTVGTNLTATPVAQTLGTTITNAVWRLWASLTVRSTGTGTAATAIGAFRFEYSILANGGSPTTIIWRSSGGAATFDSTAINGLVMGVTPSAAAVSITPRQIKWGSWS